MQFAADRYKARVNHIVDGDTITVEVRGRLMKIRLFGIDCPESKPEYGLQASRFTKNMALDRPVTIIPHDIDCYGRVVAEIVLPDGRTLNNEIVPPLMPGGIGSTTPMTPKCRGSKRPPATIALVSGPARIR